VSLKRLRHTGPLRAADGTSAPRSSRFRPGAVIVVGLLLATGCLVVPASVAVAVTTVTLYVGPSGSATTGCTSQTNPCTTIQDGVNAAEGSSPSYSGQAVTIEVAAGDYDESDTIDAPGLSSLTLQGAGASSTTIDDGATDSDFEITGGTVTIDGFTITGGSTDDSGGGVIAGSTVTLDDDTISGDSAETDGGAIYNNGTLNLSDDTISGDSADVGGGIFTLDGNVTIDSVTLSGDSASVDGGGIYASEGTATLDNDTFSGDRAIDSGGGIYDWDAGATLTNDTLSGGSAGTDGGGGIYTDHGATDLEILNSLLADNGEGDCATGTSPPVTDGNYNVADDATCDFGLKSIHGSATIGALSLAANGSTGPKTEAITSSSSAFDEIPQSACVLATDERGQPRPGTAVRTGCDAGAFELQGLAQTVSFTGPGTGTVGTAAALSATGGGSGNPVVFRVDPASGKGVCSVAGTTVSYTAAGTCVLDANQAGNLTYADAPEVSQSVTVRPPGYDLAGSDGGVFVFPVGQSSGFYGSLPGLGVAVNDIVGIVPTDNFTGYDLVGSDGGVFVFPVGRSAGYYGSLPGLKVSVDDIVGIVASPGGGGYFLVGKDGGVFTFGDAPFLGSLPGLGVSVDDVTGIASTPDGKGYYVVAADGAVYAFGDAVSHGSLPGLGIAASDIVSIVPTPDGGGYWLIGADGAVYAFGDAVSEGSLPGLKVSVDNIVGAVPTA
jgi:hypothetical protein